MSTVSTLLFLVFVNSVASSVEDNFSHKILTSESYRHNHPPSFEPYNIPDASVRKSRNVEIDENINNGQLGVDETISNSDSVLNSWSSKQYVEPVKLRSDNKPQVNNANGNVRRRKLRRNQKPPSNEANEAVKQTLPNLNEKISSVTIEPVSTSPSPRTIVPKTFTKRPVQFNPVTKRTWENTRTPVVKILEETNHVFAHNGNFHYRYITFKSFK